MNASAGLFGLGSTSWKEEVLLHDGKKIIVERSLKRGGRHEIGQKSGATNESVTFTMPETNKSVTWNDNYSDDIGSSNFNLMMVEVSTNTAYVVGSPMGCLSYNKWGRPNPPYVVFKRQGEEWLRIPLQDLPIELVTPNVVISSPDDVAKKSGQGLVSAAKIREENSGFRQPEYLTILREPMANAAGNCGEMVSSTDGGWIGIGWFRDQPTREACLNFCTQKKVGAPQCPCETLFGRK
jgi:hypothetical protein